MRRFLVTLFLFFSLFKLIDIVYYHFSISILKETYVELDYGSISRLYNSKINTDIVFFGSSRTYLHINPNIIEQETGFSTWNLGMDGSNFDQHFFTLQEYLIHNKKPKIVFFEAELQSLDTSKLRFKKYLFELYKFQSEHTMNIFKDSLKEKIRALFSKSITLSKYNESLFKIAIKLLKERILVSENSNKLEAYTDQIAYIKGAHLKRSNEYHAQDTAAENLKINNSRIKAFEELVNFAIEKKIVLVFFGPPCARNKINKINYLKSNAFFTKLSNNSPYIYYWDYAQISEFQTNLFYWWNINHLNYQGANKLSRIISSDINTKIIK